MINTNEEVLRFIVNTTANKDIDATNEYEYSIGNICEKNVKNSEHTAAWDIIYNNFVNNEDRIGFQAVKIYRGNLWTAIGIYVENTKELFLVFREANFKKIVKKPWEKHYATLANMVNKNLKPKQTELFLNSDLERKDIIIQYENLSAELYINMGVQPEKVLLCSFTPYKFIVSLYNDRQQLVNDCDLSNLIEAQFEGLASEQEDVIPSRKTRENSQINRRKPKSRIKGLKK